MTNHISPPREQFLAWLIQKLAPNPQSVSDWVAQLRAENPELSREQLADYTGDYIVWSYAKQGASLALPGAIPGLGTLVQVATELGAASVDVSMMVRNQTYLVLALSECFGVKGRETLVQDALICIGLWSKALNLSKGRIVTLGAKVAEVNFRKRVPATVFQAINRKVGTTVLTKYGTKRGGVAVGKLIPFGVGVLVGGGFNYLMMRRFKDTSLKYFSLKVSS